MDNTSPRLPCVSVIIPCYNVVDFVERAIDSAIAQGELVEEILLVDNNSTDSTLAVLTDYQEQYPDLIRTLSAARQGASAARNTGLFAAQGEWIQFLDADDELLEGKIARQLQLVRPTTDWVIGRSFLRLEDGTKGLMGQTKDPKKDIVYQGGLGDTNANLFRRQSLLGINGQDENIRAGMDVEMYLRLLMNGVKWVFDTAPGAIYHWRSGGSLSTSLPAVGAVQQLEWKTRWYKHLQESEAEYFRANQSFFSATLVRGLRQLSTFDPALAQEEYQRLFPKGIGAAGVDASVLPGYVFLYDYLGFSLVEDMRRALAVVLPFSLRERLKYWTMKNKEL